jgi:hypothetical protein
MEFSFALSKIFVCFSFHDTKYTKYNKKTQRMNRGDSKWPPEHTRQQMLEQAEEIKQIAGGPKFRPKKVHKVIKCF